MKGDVATWLRLARAAVPAGKRRDVVAALAVREAGADGLISVSAETLCADVGCDDTTVALTLRSLRSARLVASFGKGGRGVVAKHRLMLPGEAVAPPIDIAPGDLFGMVAESAAPSHAELCERAARWLANTLRCGLVVTEFQGGVGEQPDAIGWCWNGQWSVLVECKTSRADFFSDAKKPWRVVRGMGQERWYLTPPNMITAAEVPAGWGLAYAHGNRIARVVAPPGSVTLPPGQRGTTDPDVCLRELPVLYSIARRLTAGLGFDTLHGHVSASMEDRG